MVVLDPVLEGVTSGVGIAATAEGNDWLPSPQIPQSSEEARGHEDSAGMYLASKLVFVYVFSLFKFASV